MPHIIRRQDLPEHLQAKNVARYRAQLRAALANQALTPEQRQYIKRQLAALGKPKVYSPDAPPPPGAVDPTTGNQPEPLRLSESALRRLPKQDLYIIGRNEGAPITQEMSKNQMIETILTNRENHP